MEVGPNERSEEARGAAYRGELNPFRDLGLARLEIMPSNSHCWRGKSRLKGLIGFATIILHGENVEPDCALGGGKIFEVAVLYSEWSRREISCHISDCCGFTISVSTV